MPDSLRGKLSQPIGILVRNRAELADALKKSDFIVSVGDVVTLDILESGIIPDISIVDYMTKRVTREDLKARFEPFNQPEIKIKNPPGEITQELWDAIKDGYRNPRKLRIVVEGEEDLASLACISLAIDNTTVIYGIPNRGASVHHVDDRLKQLVNEVLEKMKA